MQTNLAGQAQPILDLNMALPIETEEPKQQPKQPHVAHGDLNMALPLEMEETQQHQQQQLDVAFGINIQKIAPFCAPASSSSLLGISPLNNPGRVGASSTLAGGLELLLLVNACSSSSPDSMNPGTGIVTTNNWAFAHKCIPKRRQRFHSDICMAPNLGINEHIGMAGSSGLDAAVDHNLVVHFVDSSAPSHPPKYLAEENGIYTNADFTTGLPVQFEDYYVVNLGEINLNAAYHTESEMYPVGFPSYWHDKFTGSLFEFELSDGGNLDLKFTVRRLSCAAYPLPCASTMLIHSMQVSKFTDSATEIAGCSTPIPVPTDQNGEEILGLLKDPHPSDQALFPWLKTDSRTETLPSQSEQSVVYLNKLSNHRDQIGEFFVQGSNLPSVWRVVLSTIIEAAQRAFKQSSSLQFCCNHGKETIHENVEMLNLGLLGRFCYSQRPGSVPNIIKSERELEAS